MEFTCRTCGKRHDVGEISFGAEAPVQWSLLSDEERAQSELTQELCVIEASRERHFFVRACLDIPIKGAVRYFTWGVWISLSQKNFLEMVEHWDDPSRTKLGPYFGWLCTKIPEYPDTVFLKTTVHHRPVGHRPAVILEETDHLLAIDQRDGVDALRLEEIISQVLHRE